MNRQIVLFICEQPSCESVALLTAESGHIATRAFVIDFPAREECDGAP